MLLMAVNLLCQRQAAGENHRYPAPHQLQQQRNQMVSTITRYRQPGITVHDQRVLNAMAKVPRHSFVPANKRNVAYQDRPLNIGFGQTISQPYIVALMTQLAEITSGMTVLEVGTGSGYQAAIVYELTKNVYTMEIIAPLAKRTQALFKTLALSQIRHIQGDGYFGWPQPMLFDRILVTAAAAHIPTPLLKQLKPGGRMVIPIGPVWGNQELLLITKNAAGRSITRSILAVRFVPLTRPGTKK